MFYTMMTGANAQQRSIVNPSFEDVSSVPGLGNGFEITSDSNVPGWESTDGTIEVWVDGFLDKASQDGGYFVELNPRRPVGLYQEVCLVNGESLSWTWYHAARTGGPSPETTTYEVVSLDGLVTHQTLATNTVVETASNATNDWDEVKGSTIYTGPTGTQRLQFRSLNNGSHGNFLDNIQIDLVPAIDIQVETTSDFEGSTSNLPTFIVSGLVQSPITVTMALDPMSTATPGDDFDISSLTITIPTGNYSGLDAASTFVVPLTTYIDAEDGEPDETVVVDIVSILADDPIYQPVIGDPCNQVPIEGFTHTIINVPPGKLAATKSVEIWDPDGLGLYALPGNDVIYTIELSNIGGGPVGEDSVVLIDIMPSEVEFYNGDIDDSGPELDPVSFTQSSGAGLTFTYATDVGYSDSATRPANFSECTYIPALGYDPLVSFICFNPKGILVADDPDPTVSVSFRARIK